MWFWCYLRWRCGRPGVWRRRRVLRGSWNRSATRSSLSRPAHATAWHLIGSPGRPEPTAKEIEITFQNKRQHWSKFDSKMKQCLVLQFTWTWLIFKCNWEALNFVLNTNIYLLLLPWEHSDPQMSHEACAETVVHGNRPLLMLQPV